MPRDWGDDEHPANVSFLPYPWPFFGRGNVIKLVHTVLAALVVIAAHQASADEGRKLPIIGLAIPVDASTDAPFQKAFRDGLRDLGYVDGRNVILVVRYANGDPDKYHELI